MRQAQLPRLFLGEVTVIFAQPLGDRLLVLAQLGRIVFEPGQSLHAAQTEVLRHRLLQVGCHESLDDHTARLVRLVENAQFEHPRGTIVGQHRANLVAGQQLHPPRTVAHRHTHAVVIGVGRHDQIRPDLVGQLQRHG